jgi:tRNA(Ile)-lysidine synthase
VKKGEAGLEAAAREVRYEALEKYMSKSHASRIVLGHNSDDVVETFIMNMIRGSGGRGLGAMRPVHLPYIRPLLYVKKEDIRRYVRARKLPHSEDETNKNLEHRRNLLRHKIVPQLLKVNPELHAAMHRTIQLIQMDNECLDEYTDRVFQETARKEDGSVILDLKKLLLYNPSVLGRVVRRAIHEVAGSLAGFESKHIDGVISLKDKSSNRRIDLPKQMFGQRQFDEILISKIRGPKRRTIKIDPKGATVRLNKRVVSIRTETHFDMKNRSRTSEVFDLDKLVLPLEFRTRRQGDILLTRAGKKVLKKIYSEYKIPPRRRAELLMFCDQKGILLIPGVTRAYRGYVVKNTRRFLVVDCEHAS